MKSSIDPIRKVTEDKLDEGNSYDIYGNEYDEYGKEPKKMASTKVDQYGTHHFQGIKFETCDC